MRRLNELFKSIGVITATRRRVFVYDIIRGVNLASYYYDIRRAASTRVILYALRQYVKDSTRKVARER